MGSTTPLSARHRYTRGLEACRTCISGVEGFNLIIFRCTANPTLGFGHLTRCRELARELRARGHKVALYGAPRDAMIGTDTEIFYAWLDAETWKGPRSDAAELLHFGESHGALVYILDDFRVDEMYQLVLREAGVRWLQFEGRLERPIWADLLFCAHAAADEEAFVPYIRNKRCGLLVGLRYALLRKEFYNLPDRLRVDTVKRVFVSFGGGSDRGAIELVLQALLPRFSASRSAWSVVSQILTMTASKPLHAELLGRSSCILERKMSRNYVLL